MRSAEVIAYGLESKLADRLAAWSQDHGLWFRPLKDATKILSLLRQGSRGVLLLKVGRDLVQEMNTLHEVTQSFPEMTTIILSDTDHARLEGMAYDLGAATTIFPPRDGEQLLELLPRFAIPDFSRHHDSPAS